MTDFEKRDDAAVPPAEEQPIPQQGPRPQQGPTQQGPTQPGPPPYPGAPLYPGVPGQPGWTGYPPQKSPTSVAMWAHLAALLTLTVGGSVCCIGPLVSWIAPVVIRNDAQNRHDPFIRHHATQALNHAIAQAIVVVLAVLLYIGTVASAAIRDGSGAGSWTIPIVLGCLLVALILYGLTGFVFAIIGTVKASSGQWWSYPKFLAIPFVKP